MWLPKSVIESVDGRAHVRYIGVADTAAWNKHRQAGELRLLTGWCWTAKSGREFRQGFKTETVCYRDAYYSLVSNSAAPPIARPRLRVITRAAG